MNYIPVENMPKDRIKHRNCPNAECVGGYIPFPFNRYAQCQTCTALFIADVEYAKSLLRARPVDIRMWIDGVELTPGAGNASTYDASTSTTR